MRGGRNAKKIALIVFGVISLFMLCYVVYNFFIIKEGAENETPAQKTERYKNLIKGYREKVTKLNDECSDLGGFKEPAPPTQQVVQMQSYYNKGFTPKDFSNLDDKALTSMIDNLKLAEPLLQDYKKTLSSAVDVYKAKVGTESKSKVSIQTLESNITDLKTKTDGRKDAQYPLSKLIKWNYNSIDIYSENIKNIKRVSSEELYKNYDVYLKFLENMNNNVIDLISRLENNKKTSEVNRKGLDEEPIDNKNPEFPLKEFLKNRKS